MRSLIVFCLISLPASVALGHPSAAGAGASTSQFQVQLGVDAGYQLTHYSDGFWSGDSGAYSGPALSTDIFFLWRLGRWSSAATGLRISVGYGRGTGTYEDGEGFNPAGGSGDPPTEHSLEAWYLRSNILWAFASDYFWVGAGLGGRIQKQEVATLGADRRGDVELVLAGGLELPLGRHLSLTTKAEVNSNIVMTTSLVGTAGLKLRF